MVAMSLTAASSGPPPEDRPDAGLCHDGAQDLRPVLLLRVSRRGASLTGAAWGGVLFYVMGWAEAWLEDHYDRPVLNIPIQIGFGLAAIALCVAEAKGIERREPTELSTPGLAREWGIGGLCGAGLSTACAVTLMILGIYKVEGVNPVSFMLPPLAMAFKSGLFEELVFRGVLLHRGGAAVVCGLSGDATPVDLHGVSHVVDLFPVGRVLGDRLGG